MPDLVLALLPVGVALLAFVTFCLNDLRRRPETAYLPRWAWAVVCVLSIPFGAVTYLLVGRERRAR